MRSGWILTFAVWAAAAAPVTAEENPARYASVSGVVLDHATGGAVRHAQVTLATLDPAPLEAVTFTEPNGAFGFHSIPPGKYYLYVDMAGYQEAWFGADSPSRPRAILNLAGGDNRYGITFRLRPLGAISGVVLDPDGDPVAGAQIRLLKNGWDHLKPAYKTDAWASTDDRGRYRFPGLPPGQYIAMAASYYAAALAIEPSAAPNATPSEKMYAPAFYPDTSRLSAAAPIRVDGGKEIDGIDFHLAVRVAATLRGKVLVPADMPPNTNFLISIFPQDVPEGGDQTVAANAPAPKYEFEIGNLVPGPYVLVASASAAGGEYQAVEKIELPSGAEEITVPAERGADLAGRVEVEGGERFSQGFRVSLRPAGYPPGRHEVQAATGTDGAFVLPGVTQGKWDVHVKPVPAGGFVRSIRLDDREVAGGLTMETGTHGVLRVVISTRGGVVVGTVVVPAGVARAARAAVLLAPCGDRANDLNLYEMGAADEGGHFEFTGVTPGQYRVYAFEELDRTAYEDPGFLKSFENLSEVFDVPAGGRIERQAPLILAGTGRGPRE